MNFYNQNNKAITVASSKFNTIAYTDPEARVHELNMILRFLNNKLRQQNIFKSERSFKHACEIIEKQVYSYIYKNALQPRGEVDNERDELFKGLLEDLAVSINERGLHSNSVRNQIEIKPRFMSGCPWKPAVMELKMLNAFCSPKAKCECIGRTLQKIVQLLFLSSPGVWVVQILARL